MGAHRLNTVAPRVATINNSHTKNTAAHEAELRHHYAELNAPRMIPRCVQHSGAIVETVFSF